MDDDDVESCDSLSTEPGDLAEIASTPLDWVHPLRRPSTASESETSALGRRSPSERCEARPSSQGSCVTRQDRVYEVSEDDLVDDDDDDDDATNDMDIPGAIVALMFHRPTRELFYLNRSTSGFKVNRLRLRDRVSDLSFAIWPDREDDCRIAMAGSSIVLTTPRKLLMFRLDGLMYKEIDIDVMYSDISGTNGAVYFLRQDGMLDVRTLDNSQVREVFLTSDQPDSMLQKVSAITCCPATNKIAVISVQSSYEVIAKDDIRWTILVYDEDLKEQFSASVHGRPFWPCLCFTDESELIVASPGSLLYLSFDPTTQICAEIPWPNAGTITDVCRVDDHQILVSTYTEIHRVYLKAIRDELFVDGVRETVGSTIKQKDLRRLNAWTQKLL